MNFTDEHSKVQTAFLKRHNEYALLLRAMSFHCSEPVMYQNAFPQNHSEEKPPPLSIAQPTQIPSLQTQLLT